MARAHVWTARTATAFWLGAALIACSPTAPVADFSYAAIGDVFLEPFVKSDACLDVAETSCGNGICDGLETATSCAHDCGFLKNRYARPCAVPWKWDGCPFGYLCVERSASGGGNVCVADFETWAPISDSHPKQDYAEQDGYFVDNATGLAWATTLTSLGDAPQHPCQEMRVGGFDDWHAPTLAEVESLMDLAGWGTASPIQFWVTEGTPKSHYTLSFGGLLANGFATNSKWMVNFSSDQDSVSPSDNTRFTHCVRGGEHSGTGKGPRFASQDCGKTVLDRLSGLIWQAEPSASFPSSNSAATDWCANNAGGLPGKWRAPTLGELRQLAYRDIKAPELGDVFQFRAGTYFVASSPPPAGWEKFSWHILFPHGGTDHGTIDPGAPLPPVRAACVK